MAKQANTQAIEDSNVDDVADKADYAELERVPKQSSVDVCGQLLQGGHRGRRFLALRENVNLQMLP
jgi:hypothetical protein